jgi:hypothetical protein
MCPRAGAMLRLGENMTGVDKSQEARHSFQSTVKTGWDISIIIAEGLVVLHQE